MASISTGLLKMKNTYMLKEQREINSAVPTALPHQLCLQAELLRWLILVPVLLCSTLISTDYPGTAGGPNRVLVSHSVEEDADRSSKTI